LNLLSNEELTNAATLLFSKNPQRFFIQSEVKCIRFKGTDVTGDMIDMKVIEGNIIDQVVRAENFIFEHIPKAAWIEDRKIQRQEKWLYPPKAIREALANAIAHRDYCSVSKVQVRIFDDRMEVWNPGKLPPELSLEDLRGEHKSIPRNPLIFKAFFWIKYVEEVGMGTNKIIRWCRDWGLPEPEFRHITGDFVVTLRKSKLTDEYLAGLDLNERQKKVIDYLKENDRITSSEYAKMFDITQRMARNDLKVLADKKLVLKRGESDKEAHYVLAEI